MTENQVLVDSRRRLRSAQLVLGALADGRCPADPQRHEALATLTGRVALDLARLKRDRAVRRLAA